MVSSQEYGGFSEQWYNAVSEAQDYVQLNIDDVRTVNDQWSNITGHVVAGDLDNMALVDAAKQALTSDQDASVRSLLEEAQNIPYEEVVRYLRMCEAQVSALRERINEAESVVSESQTKLIAQRELLETLAPSARKSLAEVAETELQKIKNADLQDLREELGRAEVDLEFAESLFEKIGKAWPLPSLADVNYEPGENEIFTIDEFPNERETTGELIIERVTRKFESRLDDASTYLALLLKEKPGHIWTGEELGRTIYGDDSDEKRISSRISALISNYRNGKVPIMAEEFGPDLVLQRGKRQLFDARTGKSIPKTIRVVWRLVDYETAVNAQTVTTLNAERTIRQSYGEWEPADREKIRLAQLPSGKYDGTSVVEIEDTLPELASTESVSAPTERVDWKEAFTSAVHETIEYCKEAGLMIEGGVTWKQIGDRTESVIVGAKEMREHAVRNKIIKRADVNDRSVLTVTQMVLALMQKSHPNVFRVSSRRKEASAIVDQIVQGYMRRLEQES